MALGRDRMVGLQPGSGSGLKQNSFLSGGSMTLGAGPALEQLKKTVSLQYLSSHCAGRTSALTHAWTALQADRMVEEQQSTKHATEAYVSSKTACKTISPPLLL